MDRLESQCRFVVESDKLKKVYRKSKIYSDRERYENSAEHSWHVALMALVFREHSNNDIDILKVLKMLILHDIVEIDTGDKMVYQKSEEDLFDEERAANRLFGILPNDQANELRKIWEEFNLGETNESKYASAIDKFHSATENIQHDCEDWADHNIKYQDIIKINRVIENGSKALWQALESEIERSKNEGLIE